LAILCFYAYKQIKILKTSAKDPEAAATKWFIDTVADKWCKDNCGASMTDLVKNL
jgi:hypothetical protein